MVPEILEQLDIPEFEIRQWTVPDGDASVEWHGTETVRI